MPLVFESTLSISSDTGGLQCNLPLHDAFHLDIPVLLVIMHIPFPLQFEPTLYPVRLLGFPHDRGIRDSHPRATPIIQVVISVK